jgi:hypothetical protein
MHAAGQLAVAKPATPTVEYQDNSALNRLSKTNALVLNARVANSSNLVATNPDEALTLRRTVLMVPENLKANGYFKAELYGSLCKIVLPPDYKMGDRVVVLVPMARGETRDATSPSTNSYVDNEVADTFYS